MPRIPFADPAKLSESAQRSLASVPPLDVFRLMAHADIGYVNFMRLTGGLWNDAELSPRRRELVILEVARLVDSPYEWAQHVEVARMCDISDAEIAAIERGDHEGFEPAERAILQMAGVITRRERACDEHFAAAREAMSDRELVELHLLVAAYAGLAAAIRNLDLEPDAHLGAVDLVVDRRGPRLGD